MALVKATAYREHHAMIVAMNMRFGSRPYLLHSCVLTYKNEVLTITLSHKFAVSVQ